MKTPPILNRHAESGDLAGLPYVLDTDGRLEFRCGDRAAAVALLYSIGWMMQEAKERKSAKPAATKAPKPTKPVEAKPEPTPAPEAIEQPTTAPEGNRLLDGETIIAGCERLLTAAVQGIHYKTLAVELGVKPGTMSAAIGREMAQKKAAPRLVKTGRGIYSTPEIEGVEPEPVAVVVETAPEQQVAPEPTPEPEPVAVVAEPKPTPPVPRQFTQASIDKLLAQAAGMQSAMQVIMLLQQSIDTPEGVAKFINQHKGSIPVFASMPAAQVLARIGTLAAVIH